MHSLRSSNLASVFLHLFTFAVFCIVPFFLSGAFLGAAFFAAGAGRGARFLRLRPPLVSNLPNTASAVENQNRIPVLLGTSDPHRCMQCAQIYFFIK